VRTRINMGCNDNTYAGVVSLRSENDEWIDSCRTPGRHDRRQDDDDEEGHGDGAQHPRIIRVNPEQSTGHEPRESRCAKPARCNSENADSDCLPKHKSHQPFRRCPQRDANTELARRIATRGW
jgi:hypothetical protein